ncbi:MAG: cytochrome c oxidase subunit II [Planctomycetes bacterium]|nr:cytochrome c oxidase subunit II [Planctomycetota bacterium]
MNLAFGASNYADRIDAVFWGITAVSVVLLIGITAAMVWFVWRYHRSRRPRPEHVPDSMGLELAWTIIPTILVMGMFWFGWKVFADLRKKTPGAMVVNVTGSQWQWRYMYVDEKGQRRFEVAPDEEEKKGETAELVLPLNKPVQLNLASTDVLHSFYVPAFRLKEDTVPGRETYLAFTPTMLGVFPVFCAEYCGGTGTRGKLDGHWSMLSAVRVVTEEEFRIYYESNGAVRPWRGQKTAALEGAAAMPRGWETMSRQGCFRCHTDNGVETKDGPTLKGIYGRERRVVRAGIVATVRVDEEYLRRAIEHPEVETSEVYFRKVGPMPRVELSESDVTDIIRYLRELK